jgi:hypothetical protein
MKKSSAAENASFEIHKISELNASNLNLNQSGDNLAERIREDMKIMEAIENSGISSAEQNSRTNILSKMGPQAISRLSS